MIINLTTGQEALEGESGWDTTKPYSEQANEVKAQATAKASEHFFTGQITTESGDGNTRPTSSTFTEGIAKYIVSIEYYLPVGEKGFMLTPRILINVTQNNI